MKSPLITHISWGKMEIEGIGSGRDFKLWPGGGREWDWSETDTHHEPGIQPADVQELVEQGAQVVVLTRGMELRLHTAPETIQFLDAHSIPYHIEETKAAVDLYNEFAERGVAVGGLFHSTC
jgi:hypothetical protein